MRQAARLTIALLVTLPIASCALAPGGSPGGSIAPSPIPSPSPVVTPAPVDFRYDTSPDALILRISTSGGLVPSDFFFTEMPEFNLYGDGRVIVLGPVPAIYPGPELPNLIEFTLDSRQLHDLLVEADAAGVLGPDATYPVDGIADAPMTVFTSHVNGDHVVSAYALGIGMDNPTGIDPAIGEARRKLADFAAAAQRLQSDPPAPAPAQGPYQPSAVRLLVDRFQAVPDGPDTSVRPTVAWPLERVPLATFGAAYARGGRCGVLEGGDATTFLAAARTATPLAVWRDRAASYVVRVRPLLPDEAGCPGL